jgi:hypothetical protein
MTSAIDPTVPISGTDPGPTTASMRANFATAQSEITTLQGQLATANTEITALQTDVAALKARRMPSATLNTANPVNTSSTAFVIAGIDVPFTPSDGTRAFFSVDGQLGNTNNGSVSDAQMVYGTGAMPAAGTLVTNTNGTLVDLPAQIYAARPNDYNPFSLTTVLTGLVKGQLYWLGVAYRAESGTCTLSAMSVTAFEIMDPLT